MSDLSVQTWMKRYLMSLPESEFHEIRSYKNYGLVSRQDTNIMGCHLSNGEFDSKNELKAIYEYIERLACHQPPKAEVRMRRGEKERELSFHDLGFAWTRLPFYPLKEQVRYVEGVSLKTGKEFMVPSVFAYYLDNDFSEWKNFAGNSNGNALGQSEADAIERGTLEFIERDKFIRYWYLGEGRIMLVPATAISFAIKQKIDYFQKSGYRVDFYYLDMQPEEVSVIWCLIRSIDSRNERFSYTGLGADLGFLQAIEKAFTEASSMHFFWKNAPQRKEEIAMNDLLQESIRFYFSYDREKDFQSVLKHVEEMAIIPQQNDLQGLATEIAKNYYQDVICVPIRNRILEDLNLFEVKVVGIGGNSMYFDCGEEVRKQSRINGPNPLA